MILSRILTRQDIVRLRGWIIAKLAIRQTASPQPVPSAPHLQTLFKAKSRVSANMSSTPLKSTQVEPGQSANEIKQKNEQPTEERNSQDIVPAPPETSLPTRASLLVRKRTLKSK